MSCLPNGSGAGGEAGEEPAPALGAAWPSAAGKTGRSGHGTLGKALGPGLQGPAAPISARPGPADQETGMARGMERAVELRSLLCSSVPKPSRAAAVPLGLPQATSLWPQGTAIATRGGLRGPRQAGRGGMGSAAWPPAPAGLPRLRWRKGPWSSQGQSPSAPQLAASLPGQE